MPMIQYNTIEGVLSDDQKSALSKALTQAVMDTLGPKIKPNVWVMINEAPEGNFHIGGHPLKADAMLKALQDN